MRLAGNNLSELPESIKDMSSLSWFTISANPISDTQKIYKIRELPNINLDELPTTREHLGSGASGDVSKITWQNTLVAIKLFKAEVSPDGRCIDEEAVTCSLCSDYTTSVIAKIISKGVTKGLMMKLVNGIPLAGRPDFSSYLRSKYDPNLKLSCTTALNIAISIASAMDYLHNNGICHGDLYAHNILVNLETGNSILCDYGASFFYSRQERGTTLELLEIRSFGILLDELALHIALFDLSIPIQSILSGFAVNCIQTNVNLRPTFSYLLSQLKEKSNFGGKYR